MILPLIAAAPVALAQTRPGAPRAVDQPRDRADVTRIEQMLNGIRTLKARFTQISPGNAVARGQCWMWRPGRMRFEYDPPTPILMVAGNGFVSYHDRQLNQVSHVPIGSTPLGLLLRERITLTGDVTVTRLDRPPGLLEPMLVRTSAPAEGSLTLSVAAEPMALRGWRVIDAQGQETRIALTDIELGGTFDRRLFDFVDPNFFRDPPPGGSN